MKGGRATPIVEVRVADAMDSVFLTPRVPEMGGTVVSILRDHMGRHVSVRRTADGVRVPAEHVRLLPTDSTIDYRWTDTAEQFVKNRLRAGAVHSTQYEDLCEIKSRGTEFATSLISDSAGLDVLDDHQLVNVAAMTSSPGLGLCVFDEQGAGKTVTMIYAFDLLVERDEVDLMVIVAPKSMVPEWPSDFERFRGDLYQVAVVSGSSSRKRSVLRSGADVFVTNFETGLSHEAELRALLRSKGDRALLAVDESFFIKSLDAQRTRALRRLREWCGRAYVLCGTPAPNSPNDLVQQFNLVDFGKTFGGVQIPEERDAAIQVIQRAIETRGLYVRHLKADVLPELPSKSFQRLFVPLETQQRRAYDAALRRYVLDLESTGDEEFGRRIPNFLAQRAALLQICSNPAGVVRGYKEIPAKLRTLDSLLQDLIEHRKEKVVIWSFFTASIDAMVIRFAKYQPLRYDGQVNDVEERRRAVKQFQTNDGRMLFLANPAAAGAGLTLHRARIAIYESLSNQAAHYLQSLDRIHRRGQARQVEYVIMLCDRTIELNEYERLVSKEAAAQQLLGDVQSAHLSRDTLLSDARNAVLLLSDVSGSDKEPTH